MAWTVHEVTVRTTSKTSRTPFATQLPEAIIHGDHLDGLPECLNNATGPVPGPPTGRDTIRAVVISIDGRRLGTRELRLRLLRERRDFARIIASLPRLRHLIVVLRIEREAERPATRTLDRATHRTHVELEMRRSRDICVTGIVMTDTAAEKVLVQRVDERIHDTPVEGSYVVHAQRILTCPISAAAAEDLL